MALSRKEWKRTLMSDACISITTLFIFAEDDKVYIIRLVFHPTRQRTRVMLFSLRWICMDFSEDFLFSFKCVFFLCVSSKLNSSYSNECLNKNSNPQAINQRRAPNGWEYKARWKYYECDYYLNLFALHRGAEAHSKQPPTRIKFYVINKIKFY